MIDRREFLRRVAIASAALPAPIVAAAPEALPNNVEMNLPEVVVAFEEYIKARPGKFSWAVHNELRHLYLAFNEDLSRKHADIILQHIVMDSYTLNTLSDWHFAHENPYDGIAVLTNTAHQYSHYEHLYAACLARAGMEYHKYTLYPEANDLFQRVLAKRNYAHLVTSTLRPYHALAEKFITM